MAQSGALGPRSYFTYHLFPLVYLALATLTSHNATDTQAYFCLRAFALALLPAWNAVPLNIPMAHSLHLPQGFIQIPHQRGLPWPSPLKLQQPSILTSPVPCFLFLFGIYHP